MSSVAEKLRAARRIEIVIEHMTFLGTRATPEEFSRYVTQATTDSQVCRIHIDGWKDVKESDLIEGGSDDALKFNRDDFSEAISEKPDWYRPIVAEILKDAQERFTKKAENEKNLTTGSTTSKSRK